MGACAGKPRGCLGLDFLDDDDRLLLLAAKDLDGAVDGHAPAGQDDKHGLLLLPLGDLKSGVSTRA